MSAARKEDIVIRINGNAEDFGRELKKVQKETKSLQESLTSAAKVSGAAFASLTGVIGLTSVAYREDEKALQKLEQTLRSTANSAGFTAEEVSTLALALQDVTGVADATVIEAQSILLQFDKIGKDIFPAASEAALDLAAKLGGDVAGAAKIVGRAMADPVKGMTQLERSGVILDQSQKELIKTLMATGQEAKAQAILLGELQNAVGGQARATASPLQIMSAVIGNIASQIGSHFLPAIDSAAKALTGFLKVLRDNQSFAKFAAVIIAAGAAVSGLVLAFSVAGLAVIKISAGLVALNSVLGLTTAGATAAQIAMVGLSRAMQIALGPIGLAIAAFGALTIAVAKFWPEIRSAMAGATAAIRAAVGQWRDLFFGFDKLLDGIFSFDLSKVREGLAQMGQAFAEGGRKAGEAFREAYREQMDKMQTEDAPVLPPPVQMPEISVDVDAGGTERVRRRQELLEKLSDLEEEHRRMDEEADLQYRIRRQEADNEEKNQRLMDEQEFGKSMADARAFFRTKEVEGVKGTLSNLEQLQRSGNRQAFAIGKAAAIANAVMNIAEGVTKALSYGPFLGPVMAASVAAAGAVQIGQIRSTTFQAKEGFSGTGSAFGESFVSTFTPREIVVPERFSEGIKKGEFSLTSSKEQNQGSSVTQVVLDLKGDLGDLIEANILQRRRLGVSGV